jgi:hypothetical protein
MEAAAVVSKMPSGASNVPCLRKPLSTLDTVLVQE